jgi:hypothetical protein
MVHYPKKDETASVSEHFSIPGSAHQACLHPIPHTTHDTSRLDLTPTSKTPRVSLFPFHFSSEQVCYKSIHSGTPNEQTGMLQQLLELNRSPLSFSPHETKEEKDGTHSNNNSTHNTTTLWLSCALASHGNLTPRHPHQRPKLLI